MKDLKERIEIETAYLNGKAIDFIVLDSATSRWRRVLKNEKYIVFRWDFNDYRIKPEAIQWWSNIYNGVAGDLRYPTRLAALEAAGSDVQDTILMREVMEDE